MALPTHEVDVDSGTLLVVLCRSRALSVAAVFLVGLANLKLSDDGMYLGSV